MLWIHLDVSKAVIDSFFQEKGLVFQQLGLGSKEIEMICISVCEKVL